MLSPSGWRAGCGGYDSCRLSCRARVMAAVNNWKRPWEDNIDDNHGFSKDSVPETDRLPIPHLQQFSKGSEYDTRLQRSGETTPFSQDNSEPMSGSSSKQNLSPISRDKDRTRKRPKRQSSLSDPSRQNCFEYSEGGDASSTDLSAPAPTASALTFQFEGTFRRRPSVALKSHPLILMF